MKKLWRYWQAFLYVAQASEYTLNAIEIHAAWDVEMKRYDRDRKQYLEKLRNKRFAELNFQFKDPQDEDAIKKHWRELIQITGKESL